MTTANAQPRMASAADAMTAAPQLLPAIGSQPMATIDAFRQDVRMRQDPGLPDDGADLTQEWHPDDKALGLTPDGLQTTHCVQFSVMRPSTAPKHEQHYAAAWIVV